jgi:hypothetical protein
MCSNILSVLLADPPPVRIAKDSSKFPAGILDLGILILGWLVHTLLRFLHLLWLHVV